MINAPLNEKLGVFDFLKLPQYIYIRRAMELQRGCRQPLPPQDAAMCGLNISQNNATNGVGEIKNAIKYEARNERDF